ncbi:MAG: DegV family protein [Oscillospiraceae bacterium]|nr:DegV family protein [Oscillospiraceae bacterium]
MYRIVADSSSNLYCLDGTDFAYVPLTIHCAGREFVDSNQFDIAEMNEFLKTTKARSSTSCPNISDWLAAFEGAKELFAVTITSGLSGSFTAAKTAAEQYQETHPNCKISVIDSLSAGPELCLLIEKINECKLQGLSFEETDRIVRSYQAKTHLLFSLCSLNNFARNGRVSLAKAKIAGVFGIRVLGKASDEGTLQPLENVRGETKSLQALFNLLLEHGYCGGRVIIAHCMNQGVANTLKEKINSAYPTASVTIQETGALCSYYAEDGGVLVGFEA